MKKGFTLIEVLVSSILIALVLAGLAGIFVVGKKYTLHSRLRMSAGELGKVFLGPLQMQVRQDQWSANELGTMKKDKITQKINDQEYNATYNIGKVPDTELRKVKVIIAWNETES